ncbi:uncharacterized protein LOC144419887 isoform X2 [Styela clava]
MSGRRFLDSKRPKEIGNLYIGCNNVNINNRGKSTEFQAKRQGTDIAENVFIGCHNVKKDDREATCKVQVGGGIPGTETSIVTARNTKNFNLSSSDSNMTLRTAGLKGSSAGFVVLDRVEGGTLDFTSDSSADTNRTK